MDRTDFKSEKFRIKEKDIREQPGREVTVKDQPKTPPPREQPKDAIRTFLSKNISAILRGGNKLNGKLEMVTNYELVVSINQKPIIIMKHAVDYVELAD